MDYSGKKYNLGEIRTRYNRRRSPGKHSRHDSAPTTGVSGLYGTSPKESYGIAASLNPTYHPKVSSRALPSVQVPDRVSTPMDFSQFRETGELSDITVTVDGTEFNLHKFPLYTRSDFFRALARSDSGKVVLDEFPGGAETFEMVANYCYNKRIDVSRENICKIRCAAEFLQMCSPGNLADCADRYLIDVLTTAKLNRDIGAIIDIILNCRQLGAIAEQANIIDRCVNSIVDCWLLSSKWSRRVSSDRAGTESQSFQKLCKLPLSWFKHLFVTAREKNVRGSVLGRLVQIYISDKINRQDSQNEDAEQTQETEPQEQDTKDEVSDNKSDDKPDSDGDKKDDKDEKEEEQKEDDKEQKSDEETEQDSANASTEGEESDDSPDEDIDIGTMMDTLLLELPERTHLSEVIEPKWAASMLKIADELKCKCKDLLLRLSGRLLYRFTSEDLADLPADLLSEVVQEASKDPSHVNPESVCSIVDGYLLELADRDKLHVEVFKKMALSVPKDHRQNHDVLFNVLEKLLKSDAAKVEDKDKQSLLEAVDFRRLSEAALQNAYDSKLVPDPYVTKAALALCAKLRGELETARDIIRAQEEELEKFGRSDRAGSWLQGVETDYGIVTSSPEVGPEACEIDEPPSLRYATTDDVDSFRYSPPGVDPILEKGLGGRYFDDPFHVDSVYPYCYHHVPNKAYYDESDLSYERELNRRRKLRPTYASKFYRSSPGSFKW